MTDFRCEKGPTQGWVELSDFAKNLVAEDLRRLGARFLAMLTEDGLDELIARDKAANAP